MRTREATPPRMSGTVSNIAALHNVSMTLAGRQIVRDVSLDVAPGETLLITGPSGSGKSTCVNMLADRAMPTTGEVWLYGNMLSGMSEKAKQQLIAAKVGFATQEPALDPGLTVWENLIRQAETLSNRKSKTVWRQAGELAVELGLTQLLGQKAATLSGGEQCKTAIGRALVKQPDLLVLDEPTNMVDPEGTVEVYDRLARIQELAGFTAVIVSHDEEARRYATREIVISSGLIASSHHIVDGIVQA